MRTRKLTLKLGAAALTLATLPLFANHALASEYWLRAAAFDMPDPNGGASIRMWGYALCATGATEPVWADCATAEAVTVPGPALTTDAGDSSLIVHLRNDLTVPTSLVINGLIKPMTPVWTDGTTGARTDPAQRVRSFDVEAAPGNVQTYTWGSDASPVKPGTYLYHSGTHSQVQVQMGLYGAATKNSKNADATPAEAYPGIAYSNVATLLYSEIDPDLHAAVADGSYGTTGPTSTINYAPKYFLINGHPYPYLPPVMLSNGSTLLRLLNAGLTTHVPMIQGTHWTMVAEDGNLYPYHGKQYTALLTAQKTMDVLVTPDIGGARYPIVDRRLSLSNNGVSDGGMLAFLYYGAAGGATVAEGNTAPTAVADSYDSVPGVVLNVGALEGVLVNDYDGTGPTDAPYPYPIKAVAAVNLTTAESGTVTLNSNGSFSYTPPASFNDGSSHQDSFQYVVTDGQALSGPATVTINVATPAKPDTTTALNTFNTAASLDTNWTQRVTTSPLGANVRVTGPLGAAGTGWATALGIDAGAMAIYDPELLSHQYASIVGFNDGSGSASPNAALILKASGGSLESPANFIRVSYVPTAGQVVIETLMGGSNAGVLARQAAFPVAAIGRLTAAADAKGLVTVWADETYLGGVQLPDVPAWKGGGHIGFQLLQLNAAIDEIAGGNLP